MVVRKRCWLQHFYWTCVMQHAYIVVAITTINCTCPLHPCTLFSQLHIPSKKKNKLYAVLRILEKCSMCEVTALISMLKKNYSWLRSCFCILKLYVMTKPVILTNYFRNNSAVLINIACCKVLDPRRQMSQMLCNVVCLHLISRSLDTSG